MPQFQQDPQVQSTVVGDRVVLFHRRTQSTLILNPTGSGLWALLAAPRTPTDLADALQASHAGLTGERAGADAAAFLENLQEHGLVMRHG